MSDNYSIALSDACSGFEALRPPTRMTVAEGIAENLVISQPGMPATKWSPTKTPYMVEPANALASRKHEAVVFVGPARTGKALALDTPIPTPSGFAAMGDLVAGDFVFGPDGKPTKVLVAHPVQYDRPCYEVEFSDGSVITADGEHLWAVERFNKQNEPNRWVKEVLTTEQILEFGVSINKGPTFPANRFRVQSVYPVEFTPSEPPTLDPYLLGLWLGNGSSTEARLTCHTDDVAHYIHAASAAGHSVNLLPHRVEKPNCAQILLDKAEVGNRVSPFRRMLKALGLLGHKHIPAGYLYGDLATRRALLQGLMDSDGSSCGNDRSLTFGSSNPDLVAGMTILLRSLGLRVCPKKRKVSWVSRGVKKTGWTTIFRFVATDDFPIFRLPRKLKTWRPVEERVGRAITAIRPVPSVPVRCIGVDNADHLFLAGEGFVPTHNTMSLLVGWMSHNVVNDPGDMLFIQMNKENARAFSKTDIDRAIRYSTNVKSMKSERAIDSNTFDTMFRHGMWLRIVWPTVSNVSGSTYRYVAITDIDRIENAENVDGEGPLFDLAKKRTTTFLSRGMTLVESSPGKPFEDPKWAPATPHEAPPTKGILSLYNRSDRHRFYWQCPDCSEHFEAAPGLSLFSMLPSDAQLLEEVRSADIPTMAKHFAKVICPCCGSLLEHKQQSSLNAAGIWLPDGVSLDKDGNRHGEGMISTIRGYWLGGVAAAYQSWDSIVAQYLYGLRDYALTGSEEKLKQTTNTDQGMPYMARHLVEAKEQGTSARERGEVDLVRHVAPAETRAVTVSVDVQGGQNARFDVQVHAVGAHGEQWVIDRFALKESKRPGAIEGEFAPIDPASYPEDWDVLTDRILLATWRTPLPNLELRALGLIVDSGGEDGVTHNAYAWYRRVAKLGFSKRVRLYKGGSIKDAPEHRETMVGKIANKGRDDVPLLLCQTNKLSDAVDANLRRQTAGPGYIHFPAAKHPTINPNGWVSPAFFDELEAEVRGANGVWTQTRKRNETFDHCRMQRALHLFLGVYKIADWDVVPAWFAPIERNSMLVTREDRREMQENTTVVPPPEPVARIAQPMVRRRRRASVAAL